MDYIKRLSEITDKNQLALIHTFGCQQNENDSEKIAGVLHEIGYGFTDDANKASLIIFNTCAIRENAEKKVYGMLGALKPLKEMRPNLIIALCGCMANEEKNIKKIKSTFKQVDIVFGTNSIQELPRFIYEYLSGSNRVFCTTEDELIHEDIPYFRKDSVKAGVPIMYGCNNFCTYCIVPYVRGRERSRAEGDVVEDVKKLIADGCREVMLLGQNVNSYNGGGDAFANLLQKVADTGIDRIRFMTSHPKDISDSVIRVMAENKNICKSLHLPLQAGSDAVLKSMNRKYTSEWFLQKVDKIRDKMPDIALTTDIIVGFPSETNDDFEKTLDMLRKVRFDMIYSFIFSPRSGTPAAKMPFVLSDDEIKANFERLLEVQNEISLEKNKALTGKTELVLVEGESKTNPHFMTGRTEGNKIVNFPAPHSLKGEIVPVKIVKVGTFSLEGELI
ncbi:MAG: tRNA (N6-isopentenyl adenosine(37)-C2)-methylthiotransferase MiaB [Clostridia bacterium]|nr:tRNA (N6-isopentenyl adenosine(37)-C2)-methylthiotransferase MiaB [Clostridia bacterium]